MMQRHDLHLLAAMARATNVRQAALALGVPRSTLSYRLTELEDRLGREIFLRRGRRLLPTRYGETLLAAAHTALEAMERLDTAMTDDGGESLTIATSPLMAETILTMVLHSLRTQRPALRVDIRLSHDYVDLFDGKVDIAVRRGPLPNLESLGARRLGHTTLVCVASPRLVMPKHDDHEVVARALPWVRIGSRLEPLSFTIDGRVLALTPSIAVDSQRLAVDLAVDGVAAVRANWFYVREHIAAGRLREVLPEARSTESVFAVYPRRRRLSKLVRDAVDAIAVAAKKLDVWDDGRF